MDVKVLKPFYDKLKKVDREVGETFSTNQQRLDEINAAGFGELVRKVAARKKATPEDGE